MKISVDGWHMTIIISNHVTCARFKVSIKISVGHAGAHVNTDVISSRHHMTWIASYCDSVCVVRRDVGNVTVSDGQWMAINI